MSWTRIESCLRSALEDVEAVPGVRQIATEVTSPDIISDADAHSGSTAGGITQGATDTWITAATKLRLLANSRCDNITQSTFPRRRHGARP